MITLLRNTHVFRYRGMVPIHLPLVLSRLRERPIFLFKQSVPFDSAQGIVVRGADLSEPIGRTLLMQSLYSTSLTALAGWSLPTTNGLDHELRRMTSGCGLASML